MCRTPRAGGGVVATWVDKLFTRSRLGRLVSLLLHAFGVTGLLLLLGSFMLTTLRVAEADSVSMLAGNAAGAGILTIYSALTAAWVFFPLEGVWTMVALVGLGRVAVNRRRARAKA